MKDLLKQTVLIALISFASLCPVNAVPVVRDQAPEPEGGAPQERLRVAYMAVNCIDGANWIRLGNESIFQ